MKSQINPGISDAAVAAKTGKEWSEWFAILDAAGCTQKNHKEIVALLDEKYALNAWWTQMITVTYEKARGLRQDHEKPAGFEISRSKTIDTDVEQLFNAFRNEQLRKQWLPVHLTIRTATPGKSMRCTWEDGKTIISVNFYPKEASKGQVVVQHVKLASAEAAEQMKNYWSERLEKLKAVLEEIK